MIPHRRQLHQSIRPVFFIQPEHHSYKDRGCRCIYYYTYSLVNSDGIHYHEKNKDTQQTAHEQKEILRTQTPEFDRFPDPFIDIEF